ncbi:hypothetical protein KKH36_00810 [Patescibacteria group bacterium]|nr:hypothetical protein [Patescibacteria group bacterium]
MKTKLIFIHGADPIKSKNKIIQKMIYFIYENLFNFVPKYGFKKESWSKAFEKDGFDVININWNGKIIPYGVSDAINKTIEVLWRDLDCNYVFFTESIGTEIAFSAIEKCNYKNTKGFFAICPVNKPREINDFL